MEYLNPSFLVKKPNGGSRLVTAFADVGRYSKPQPALLPDVDSTLLLVAQWKHIIVTDLTSAFYQIPLARESMKYCGVATPFKGVRVWAYEKLFRGAFSASPRVSNFLSVVSRYQASVRHVSGSAILPSDFASWNTPPCEEESCQVCSFIMHTKESVVRMSSVQDILDGNLWLPFTSRPAWLAIQSECPDLRRTHSHLVQGTRPSRKLTNVKDLKRYLQVASVASDGLLVVKHHEPLSPSRECIVDPRQVLDGLLTALHIQLNHPSSHQLRRWSNFICIP